MTDLPSGGKVTSDKKMTVTSHQRYKSENRDHCSHFKVTFEKTGKFLIVFVRLKLGKVGVNRATGPQREIDNRYESNLKIISKG